MARTPKVVEDRREQIMEAALRVFAEKGFDRATNKDIAEAAGITPGLIYHYFESKEALLHAIIETGSPIQGVRALPDAMLTQPPEIVLRAALQQMLVAAESESFIRLIRIVLPEILHHPDSAQPNLSFIQEAGEFLEQYLAAQMEAGELRYGDPVLTAQVMMNSMMGFVLRRQVFHDELALQFTQDEIAESVVMTALQGLRPR